MYVTSKFVFLEIPKTGSTYIDQIMIDMLDGQKIGKHNYPSDELLNSDRLFVGSIRNPFDWYVSLWAYGCKVKERSAPYRKTMSYRPFDLKGYGFDKNLAFGIKAYANYLAKAPFKNKAAWKSAYADNKDPANFRTWLNLMFRSGDIYLYNSIFGQTRLKDFAGLYTFRYLWLCCRNLDELLTDKCPRNLGELRDWEQRNCYVDSFIKMENMSEALVRLFGNFGYELTDEQLSRLAENKRHKNATNRSRNLNYYYDAEMRELIFAREAIIFEKFEYNNSL